MFYGVVIGAFALGNALPNLQYFTEARGAAYSLWTIIDTVCTTFDCNLDYIRCSDCIQLVLFVIHWLLTHYIC